MILTAAKAVPIERELERRGIRLKRAGAELIGPCPRCGGTDRFGANIRKQKWNCRGCGGRGDVVDLVRHLDDCTFAEAVRTLTGMSARSTSPAHPIAATPPPPPDGLKSANRIWRETVGIAGTDGESYFDRRGIVLNRAPNYGGLRFHPRCPWERGTTPCVIGRFTDAITGEPRGIWRRPIDGRKPKALGPMGGCVIRLWPDEEVSTGLVIGEGVETVLSAATRFTRRGALLQPAWATGSAGNLERFPILAGIETLTILVDRDESGRGQEAAARCAIRWAEARRNVTKLTPHTPGDFNDDLMRQLQGGRQ